MGNDSSTNLTQMAYDQHGPIRPVFGSPLGEAVRFNHPADVQIELPAVVYRCIEYLDAKNAAGEEGIFRLSGSNVVIKQKNYGRREKRRKRRGNWKLRKGGSFLERRGLRSKPIRFWKGSWPI